MAMAGALLARISLALQTVVAWLCSPAPKQPSAAVEAAAPAAVAEEKEAIQGAAEAGAAPPLPGASVLPADEGAGGAAASDEAAAARLTVPRQAVDEAVVAMPMPAFVGRQPALHNPAGAAPALPVEPSLPRAPAKEPPPGLQAAAAAVRWRAQEPPGRKTPPAPIASCASMPALHNPVGAASTAVATSPAVHVLSPRGLTSAAPRPLEPPPGLALSGFVAMQENSDMGASFDGLSDAHDVVLVPLARVGSGVPSQMVSSASAGLSGLQLVPPPSLQLEAAEELSQ